MRSSRDDVGLEVAAMGSVIGLEAARAAEARATSSGFFQDDMPAAQRARVERDVRACAESESRTRPTTRATLLSRERANDGSAPCWQGVLIRLAYRLRDRSC